MRAIGRLAGLVSLLASVTAGAAPLRAVVVEADARDAEVVTRVRGQVSDLDVELVVVRVPVPADLAEAARLAESEGGRVVIFFTYQAGTVVAHVTDPATRSELVREVRAADATGASARAEAAALVVRGALRALVRGGRIGVSAPPGQREPKVPPDAPEPRQPAPEPAPEPAPVGAAIEVRGKSSALRISLGWQAAFDPETPSGQMGLDVRLGLNRGRWHVALGALAGLPVTLQDERVAMDVTRHGLLVAGGLHGRRAGVQWSGGLALGVLAFFRSSAALAADIEATPSTTTPVFFVSPEVSAGLRIGGGMVLALTAAADVLLPRPDFGYQIAGAFESQHRFWPIEPRAAISMTFGAY